MFSETKLQFFYSNNEILALLKTLTPFGFSSSNNFHSFLNIFWISALDLLICLLDDLSYTIQAMLNIVAWIVITYSN